MKFHGVEDKPETGQFRQKLSITENKSLPLKTRGSLLSRSRDLPRLLGTRFTPEQIADYRRHVTGFVLRRSVLDQVERGIAHRWISAYPLLLVVARTPDTTYAEIAAAQQLAVVFGGGTSLIVLAALALMGRSWHRREQAELLLQREHANLAEAQRIAQIGSWELDLGSGRLYWSDEAFRIFEIDQHQVHASCEAFFNAIHPDDRAAVNQAYADALKKCKPCNIAHPPCQYDLRHLPLSN